MKYVIYGANRVAKDFIYIFSSKIEIVAVVEDVEKISSCEIEKVTVFDIKQLKSIQFDQVIICDYEKINRKKKLEKLGLQYGKEYLYEEDLFSILDKNEINPNKKPLVIWGTGGRGEKYYRNNNNSAIKFYIDSFRTGYFFEYEIKKPEKIDNWKNYFVIITPANNDEIIGWLKKKNLDEYKDYCTMQEYLSIPSNMLKKTIFDKSYYGLVCNTMHNHIEVHAEGRCDCCCTTFMDISIGELYKENFEDIWSGPKHEIAVLSAENHTYSFCKKDMCPLFYKKQSSDFEGDLSIEYKKMDKSPKVLLAAYDNGCNLKCVSCRKDYIFSDKKKQDDIECCVNKIKKTILPSVDFLIAAGSGEVFLNKSYKELYLSEEAKKIKEIRFLSNGILFNENNWNQFRSNNKSTVFLTVSIDAATKKTYENIRRGGNFDVLLKNMDFAGKLRKKGDLSYFRMNFVVQKNNYKEMPDFVRWGKRIGCDEIFFTKILNWGTYSQEEFVNISMMEKDGVTPKTELKRVMEEPIMQDSIVNMGTIQFALSEIEDEVIDNYYIWEIGRTIGDVFSKENVDNG